MLLGNALRIYTWIDFFVLLILFVGNKADCRIAENAGKCVVTEQVRKYAEEEKLLFNEVSAKSGENVSQSLQTLAEAVCKLFLLPLLLLSAIDKSLFAVKKAQIQKRIQPPESIGGKQPSTGANGKVKVGETPKTTNTDGTGCGC